jgi:hypothetical protein
MRPQLIQANHFVLKEGIRLEITYDETSLDGQPQLTYRVFQGPPTRTFRGDQIRTTESEIGTQVTVTLQAVADGDSSLLTLLLPTVNLEGTSEQICETFAIFTTVRGSIAGPNLVTGAVQSYNVVKLEGTAQFVTS